MSHFSEPSIEKCMCSFRMMVELKYKLLQWYAHGKDVPLKDALVAACEEVTKDVKLSADSLDSIRKEIEANYQKRMKLREERRDS